MTPPLLRDLGFPRNQPENWPRRHRGRRQPATGSNDQQRTYHQGTPTQGLIPNQIQPRSPTRILDRCRTGPSNTQTPERPLHMEHGQQNVHYGSIMGRSGDNNSEDLSQANGLDRTYDRNARLEPQQEFQTLRRKSNQNQREPGSHTSHREILAQGRAQSDSGTPRNGRRSPIFPTTIQQFQALQAKGNFIQGSPTIPGSFQQEKRSPREKQNFFQPEEERSRPIDEKADGLSPRSTQKQKIVVPTNSFDSSDSIDPELITETTINTHEFENKFTWTKLAQFMDWTHETSEKMRTEVETLKEENAFQATVIKDLNKNLAKIWTEFEKTNRQLN
ncbi:hypothetical protein O181_131458 [Austropuccinia psidii MF-1]|uniref:Uncharacterized protein n=1 Tax=Austropuccinia psidii MF-1 TaxID=1389203 RepID=A0A9Q3L1Z4_9BASI|nr:hypothetical protein [Austropuccinia psidii MF-1]